MRKLQIADYKLTKYGLPGALRAFFVAFVLKWQFPFNHKDHK